MISLRKLLPLLALIICLGILYLPGCDTMITEVIEYTIAGHPIADFALDTDEENCYPDICKSDSGCTPHTVRFLDMSNGPCDMWIWDFGDGTTDTADTIADSTDTAAINPIHTYAEAGVYDVSLTVKDNTVDGDPGVDRELKKRFIIVGTTIDSFSADTLEGCPGLEVTFTPIDYGGITSYSWDFGDSSAIDTNPNPTHIYDSVGTFSCTLTIDAACGDNVPIGYDSLITINACPVAYIAADKYEGCVPCTVMFADTSNYRGLERTFIEWQIGEDNPNDTLFEHVFDSAGVYTVNLSIESDGGTDDTTEVDYITVWGPPTAKIKAVTPTQGCLAENWLLYVTFEAEIPASSDSQEYDSLVWDFGDGYQSNPADPLPFRVIHPYRNEGTYSVKLTSYGKCYYDGDSAMVDSVVDMVCVAWPLETSLASLVIGPDADTTAAGIQGYTSTIFTFADTSTLTGVTWSWEFGDDITLPDTTRTIEHQYTTTGTKIVTLTLANCCNDTTLTDTIVIDTMGAFGTFRRYNEEPVKR